MSNSYIYYLNDTIRQLIDLAKEVKETDDYNQGILYGYYASISRLLNQAEAFDIIENLDKDIQNFKPEKLFSKNEDENKTEEN